MSILASPIDWPSMTRDERVGYLNFHGDTLARAFAEWQTATKALAQTLEDCGAFERRISAKRFTEDLTDSAAHALPYELLEYLGL